MCARIRWHIHMYNTYTARIRNKTICNNSNNNNAQWKDVYNSCTHRVYKQVTKRAKETMRGRDELRNKVYEYVLCKHVVGRQTKRREGDWEREREIIWIELSKWVTPEYHEKIKNELVESFCMQHVGTEVCSDTKFVFIVWWKLYFYFLTTPAQHPRNVQWPY